METPKKPSLQSPIVSCCFTIENLTSQGTIRKTTNYKKAQIVLGRNEFKDIILQVNTDKTTQKFSLRDFQMHTKFVKEGKATIRLKESLVNLMISNAPPNLLLSLLKILAAKNANSKPDEKVPMRERLKSCLPQSFDEISPLTCKEYEKIKKPTKSTPETNKKMEESPISSRPKAKRKRSLELKSPRPSKTLRFQNPIILTKEQRNVLDAISSGRNVFFTGSAGTGKSFLLKRIVGSLPPDMTFVTASTGVAACQINGTTLHAFAGIGTGEGDLDHCFKLARRKEVAQNWRKCKHLVIDEISMVDGDFFQKLEAVARKIRGVDKPFGGIQLILCGDFLQLPPVTKRGAKRVFCFQTQAWDKCMSVNMELTDVRRQDDKEFIDILQSIRLGRCPEEMVQRLKETSSNSVEKNGIQATRLCTHIDDVNHINQEQLTKLPGCSKTFVAVDTDPSMSKILDNQTPVTQNIVLKVGAQIMLMKNIDISRGLVNGARGVIVSFATTNEGCPIVKFMDGSKLEVKHEKFIVKGVGGSYVTRRQVPLKLAWAFSIHKSQGMTLDCVQMSLSRVFEAGQAYVALSRARNLNSIRLIDFNSKCIKADPEVLKFYSNLMKLRLETQMYITDRYIKLGQK